MLTLLTPAALLALLGLLVPVAIHLWNRRPGREVAVGSLRWLATGANRRLRNLKPEQLWLLLLRTALLATLAVAASGPAWREALPAGQGQVLLGPDVLGTSTFAALRPQVDSLRRRGYALRWLAPGFAPVPVATWRADSLGQHDTTSAQRKVNLLLWARVQQAVGAFPSQPLFVVTSAAQFGFRGPHLPLPAAVTWQLLPDTTSSSWLQAATIWGKRGDSLRLLVGRSNASQTTFRTETIGNRNEIREQFRIPGLPPLRLDTAANGSRTFKLVPAQLGASPAPPVDCGMPPQVIEIYASPAYAVDARYLEAALRAAVTGLLNPPVLRRVTRRPLHLGINGWVFWLSDEPLPGSLQDNPTRTTHVWREAAGPGTADTSQLAADELGMNGVAIFRRGAAQANSPDAPGNVPVWTDGQGRPVLTRQTLGRATFYQLHTRLHPAWSELADSPALPTQLLALLQPETTDTPPPTPTALDNALAAFDQRALDPMQLTTTPSAKPGASAPVKSAGPTDFRFTDLRPWFVLAAGLLFALERLLAHRRNALSLPTTS